MPPSFFEPSSPQEAAALLAEASRRRLPIAPRGGGTKLEWVRRSSEAPTCLSTRGLSGPIQHFAGDLVATLPAGATLAEANRVLAQSGQWLPLDPPFADRATIGGIVAANDSGPRRHRHGSPRDLIIGIELALCDGRVAKAGGRVVKNVAGYDLSRLACGSLGSLAVITSATFKLAPLASASMTLSAVLPDSNEAARLALRLAALPLSPSALEIAVPEGRVLIRFESTGRAAEQMTAAAAAQAREVGATTETLAGDSERLAWAQHEASFWDGPGPVARVSVLPTEVEGLLTLAGSLNPRLDWSAAGRAGLGVLLLRVNAPDGEASAFFKRCAEHITGKGGTIRVIRGSTGASAFESAPDPGLHAVMTAVKTRFDPEGVLPGLP